MSLIFPFRIVLGESENKEFMPPSVSGVKISKISKGRLNAYHYKPEKIEFKGTVVIVSGSDGGYDFAKAEFLSWRGFNVFCLSYFNSKNLPDKPLMAPVDVLDEFIEYARLKNIDTENITIIGSSLGSAFAQVAANNYKEVKNIVLYSPLSYVLPYFDNYDIYSNLSFRGESVPFINPTEMDEEVLENIDKEYKETQMITQLPYVEMLLKYKQEDLKPLDLSNFNGKILIFVGEDDLMIPAKKMAEEIKENYKGETIVHTFKDAGHHFSGRLVLGNFKNGGTKKGILWQMETAVHYYLIF